jgi:hypothetical protein
VVPSTTTPEEKLMTLTQHRTETTASTRRRLPAPALTAAVLVLLMGAMGAYGAIYFTGLEGWDDFGYTYVTTYEYLAFTGVVSAIALLRGHRLGLVGVLWFATFQVVFTACKLVTIQEVSSIPFGVAALVVLALATRPSVRAFFR